MKTLTAMAATWALLLEFATNVFNAQLSTFVLHVNKRLNMITTFSKWRNLSRNNKIKTKIVSFGKLEGAWWKEWNHVEPLQNHQLRNGTENINIAEEKASFNIRESLNNINSTRNCSNFKQFLENKKTLWISSKSILISSQKNWLKFMLLKTTSHKKTFNWRETWWEKLN